MSRNIVIVAGLFHKEYVETMLEEARSVAKVAKLEVVNEIWVPGSLEKPLILKHELMKPDVAGAVVLGIIERGETKHGLVMGQAVFKTILELELEFMKPIGVGILGPEILPNQIESRLKPHAKNAVLAVKTMLDLFGKSSEMSKH